MPEKLVLTASDVTLTAQSRRYMTLKMRILSTRENRNHHAVTEAFIDKIVANEGEYLCMPLCADVARLAVKDYKGLTHMYDETEHVFHAPQIGGFIHMEKVSDDYGVSLIGTARVNKRNPQVTEAIQELYAKGMLNFSFEVLAGTTRTENGVLIVDAADDNDLTGVAIVSIPAYPEAEALSLAAETKEAAPMMIESAYVVMPDYTDINALFDKVCRAVCEYLMVDYYRNEFYPRELHAGYMLFHIGMSDRMYRADYSVDEDGIPHIAEVYEVVWTKATNEVDDMDNEQMTTPVENAEVNAEAETVQAEEQPVVAEETVGQGETEHVETDVQAQAETETVTEEETVQAEAEPEQTEETEAVVAEAEEPVEEPANEQEDPVAALRAEVEQIRAERDALIAEKQAAEDERKRASLTLFAQAQGLDMENDGVKNAIEKIDYAAIIAEIMNKTAPEQSTPTVRIGDDMQMRDNRPFGGLLDRE